MQTQETKLTYGIKGKLISAVAMLLVAIIMVVSSTYAWFTLSTAPEVTGISTAVGANGALEMLLLTQDATTQEWVYGEGVVEADKDVNTYWGNLVDVSSGYGLDKITLYPSQLATTGDIIKPSIVEFPVYGADGRVSNLSDGAVTGIYEGTAFNPGDGYGVRAVGSSSGMTERQLAYRNALSAAGTNMSQARKAAASALFTNGNAIADIAIRKGTAESGDGAYTQKDMKNLVALTTDLTAIVAQMEEAYKQFIIAYAASAALVTPSGADEAIKTAYENFYATVENWFSAENTIYNFGTTIDGITINLPTQVADSISKLATTKANVAAAHTGLTGVYDNSLPEDTAVEWTAFNTYLHKLVDVNGIKVAGWKVDEIITNKDAFAQQAMAQFSSGGIALDISTGGGVLADIADQCGNYEARITISEITYGVTLTNIPAFMNVKTTNPATYLGAIKSEVDNAGAPKNDGAQQMPISEFYGYIIDLAFRTNAAESNLLLQTAPKDRIYSDNAENDQTWGKGSTMTFKATAADFTDQDVKDLMKNIKIVFFTPDTEDGNKILAYAKLDIENAVTSAADGVTANIYLYDVVDGVETLLKDGDAVIQALTQNEAAHVSVLVYLDGTTITNADVAATVATSMTGTMNLQFASSATLVPMDYAQYQNGND
ncbi:MAG: hypothetical protein IKT37_04220 [Clostridia bacterium]|nr:hypothetical protein [Clostridia bacterium]